MSVSIAFGLWLGSGICCLCLLCDGCVVCAHELLQSTGKRLLFLLCDGFWPSFSAELSRIWASSLYVWRSTWMVSDWLNTDLMNDFHAFYMYILSLSISIALLSLYFLPGLLISNPVFLCCCFPSFTLSPAFSALSFHFLLCKAFCILKPFNS